MSSVPAFEVCPFCKHFGFVADNVVYKPCERHSKSEAGPSSSPREGLVGRLEDLALRWQGMEQTALEPPTNSEFAELAYNTWMAVRAAALALQAAEQREREAFKAGFHCCCDNTDKYGEFYGDSLDEEYARWVADRKRGDK